MNSLVTRMLAGELTVNNLMITPVTACNLHCEYCNVGGNRDLSFERNLTFIEETIANFKFDERLILRVMGGEPLLDVEKVCTAIKVIEKYTKVPFLILYTNFQLLTEKIVEMFGRFDRTLFLGSIDTREKHPAYIANLELVGRLQREGKAQCNFVISGYEDFTLLPSAFELLSVNEIKPRFVFNYYKWDEISRNVDELAEICVAHGIQAWRNADNYECSTCRQFRINPDGTVSTCSSLITDEAIAKASEFREKHCRMCALSSICKHCERFITFFGLQNCAHARLNYEIGSRIGYLR